MKFARLQFFHFERSTWLVTRQLLSRISSALAICWIVLGGGTAVAEPQPQPLSNTGDSIRLLTFNTYLLSPLMRCNWTLSTPPIFLPSVKVKLPDLACHLFDADIDGRARQIGGKILLANDKFDVVAFNEVWDEDAKDRLEEKLLAVYPY